MVGETSDSRIEAKSGFMCFVNGAEIIGVALGHERVDAALPERGEDLLGISRIAPELWENECAGNPFRRQAIPPLDPKAKRVRGCSWSSDARLTSTMGSPQRDIGPGPKNCGRPAAVVRGLMPWSHQARILALDKITPGGFAA